MHRCINYHGSWLVVNEGKLLFDDELFIVTLRCNLLDKKDNLEWRMRKIFGAGVSRARLTRALQRSTTLSVLTGAFSRRISPAASRTLKRWRPQELSTQRKPRNS